MLKLINFIFDGDILSMTVLIEGNEDMAYDMSVDISNSHLNIVQSSIPDDYKIYERQAKTALRRYQGKELPAAVTSMWY